MGVLGAAIADGAFSGGLHQGRCGEIGLTDIEKHHGLIAVPHFLRNALGGFGHLHHIKRLDALGALRDAHAYSVAAVGDGLAAV